MTNPAIITLLQTADPDKLAAKAAKLAKGDPDFNQLLSSWCDLMENHLGSSQTTTASNAASGIFIKSPVVQTNIVR